MHNEDLVRAWKDPDRRADDQTADHPSGEIAFSDDRHVGGETEHYFSWLCAPCHGFTTDTCLICTYTRTAVCGGYCPGITVAGIDPCAETALQ